MDICGSWKIQSAEWHSAQSKLDCLLVSNFSTINNIAISPNKICKHFLPDEDKKSSPRNPAMHWDQHVVNSSQNPGKNIE